MRLGMQKQRSEWEGRMEEAETKRAREAKSLKATAAAVAEDALAQLETLRAEKNSALEALEQQQKVANLEAHCSRPAERRIC